MSTTVIRTHRGRLRRRSALVLTGLFALTFGLFAIAMTAGSFVVSLPDVTASVLHLVDNPPIDFIVRGIRLPRAATAVLAGLALGVSGAIFQRLLNNPLASPDFVGISSGAGLAAVLSIMFFSGGLGTPVWALIGGTVSALLVYLLAWRDGITGYRFILIGIGVAEFMTAITGYLLSRAEINDARAAMTWLVGSVGQAGGAEIAALAVTVAVLVPAATILERPLRTVELGDATARGLGLRVEPTRLALIGIALVLVAVATAATGPLAFVALLAGPIARRLLGPAHGSVPGAALVGGVIVLGADLICQHLLPTDLPTGVITGAVGAPYLIWLLATVNRKGGGG